MCSPLTIKHNNFGLKYTKLFSIAKTNKIIIKFSEMKDIFMSSFFSSQNYTNTKTK